MFCLKQTVLFCNWMINCHVSGKKDKDKDKGKDKDKDKDKDRDKLKSVKKRKVNSSNPLRHGLAGSFFHHLNQL